jgi:hypothetical protein
MDSKKVRICISNSIQLESNNDLTRMTEKRSPGASTRESAQQQSPEARIFARAGAKISDVPDRGSSQGHRTPTRFAENGSRELTSENIVEFIGYLNRTTPAIRAASRARRICRQKSGYSCDAQARGNIFYATSQREARAF